MVKRILRTVAATCLLFLGVLAVNADTVDSDKLSKSLKKECKKAVKLLKRDGWMVHGISKSIEETMTAHFLQLEKAGVTSMVIEGNGKGTSVNMAVSRAMNNASSQLATMKGSTVEGQTDMNISNEASSEATTHTTLNASYSSTTRQKLKNFKPTAVFYRKTDGNSYEARALYIVENEE